MKKLLLLGGSHRDIPLIKAAKKLGFFVITLGDRDYYLGHNYADKYYKIDFNDEKSVTAVIKNEQVDALIPGSGEDCYIQTVKLGHKLGLGNFDELETAKLVHNKWKFKEFCLKNDIATPDGIFFEQGLDITSLTLPVAVKPTNLSGGRGIKIVKNIDELIKAITSAKEYADEVFLERFIDGPLISYSIFLKDQRVNYEFLAKDDVFLNQYKITTAYPIKLADEIIERLKQDIEKIAKLLNLVDGMFHVQAIVENNVPKIIDVCRRIPGDFYPDLIEYADKVEYSKSVIKSYIGESCDFELEKSGQQKFVIRHCVMSSKNGQFIDIEIDNSIKSQIISRFDLIESGSDIEDFINDQISIIFISLEKDFSFVVENINQLIKPMVTD